MKTKRKNIIKINKKIYIIFLFIIFLFNTGIYKANLCNYLEEDFNEKPRYFYYTVQKNDNLWNIVDEFRNGIDKRYYINLVMKENEISGTIKPGDILLIPNIKQ